eukprot:COSAG01_NODE_8966_length_2600_cov_4.632947_3_plen_193_part_00
MQVTQDRGVAVAVAAATGAEPRRESVAELKRKLMLADAEIQRLRDMPPMCAGRLTMDPKLQRDLPKLTGAPSYGVHKAVVRLFQAYYPYGIRQYRYRESIPDDVFEAALAEAVKDGTPAPAAKLPWVQDEGSVGAGPAGAAAAAAAAVPSGRHGSGICAAEEEEEEESETDDGWQVAGGVAGGGARRGAGGV